MINEIKQLMDQYSAWLRDNIALRQIEDWVEITTPYLDRHNDYLQMYVKRSDGGYMLTDDGYIIQDLELSGCKLESRKRRDLLTATLNGFGVKLESERNALTVKATAANFAMRKHNLLQAMLAVNDLFYMAAPTVTSLFLEDVTAWLEGAEIRFVPNVKFTGKSGYDHVFDFAIPKSRKRPERIIRAINRPDRDAAQALAFAWLDTKDVRAADSEAYALLNDIDQPPSPAVIDALKNYDVFPVPWSQREQVRDRLAA